MVWNTSDSIWPSSQQGCIGKIYRCNDHKICGKLPVKETVEIPVTSTCLSVDCLEFKTNRMSNKLLYITFPFFYYDIFKRSMIYSAFPHVMKICITNFDKVSIFKRLGNSTNVIVIDDLRIWTAILQASILDSTLHGTLINVLHTVWWHKTSLNVFWKLKCMYFSFILKFVENLECWNRHA
jgi:hypothetical protein